MPWMPALAWVRSWKQEVGPRHRPLVGAHTPGLPPPAAPAPLWAPPGGGAPPPRPPSPPGIPELGGWAADRAA